MISNSHRMRTVQLTASLALLIGAAFTPSSLVTAEDEADQPTARKGTAFEDYELILNNNIFDPNRQDRARLAAERLRAREDSIPVHRFALVGTMHNNEESLAFFSGTSSEYRSVLKPGDAIADYQIKAIHDKEIVLDKDGETIEFQVGMEMSRQGDNPWTMGLATPGTTRSSTRARSSSRGRDRSSSESRFSTRPSSARSSETSEPSDASKSDILKRMMERRRQQENQ